MSSTLSIDNFGTQNRPGNETTLLDADVAVNANTLTFENAGNFTADTFFILGTLGSESAELLRVQTASANVVTLVSSTTQPHTRFDTITKLFGDKLKIYRASNVDGSTPVDASFALATGGTIDLDADQLNTAFTDTTGSSDFWYKFTYYNSVSSLETSLADSNAARGNGYGDYTSIHSIRDEAGFKNNRNISDAQIDEHRQAAQAEINGKLAARYAVPFASPVNPFIADITKRLAAGFLQIQQYGSYTVLDTNNGSSRVDRARADIKELQDGTMGLVGAAGISTPATTGTGGFNGWPNNTTETASTTIGGSERLFRISSVNGFSDRKY